MTYGTEALGLMYKNKLEPTPDAYRVWYAYVSGQHTELVDMINKRMESKEPFDSATMYELQTVLNSPAADAADAALDAGERLSGEMGKILDVVQAVNGNTSQFGESMKGVSAALSSEFSEGDLGRVVETIVAATQQMESRSRELEERLNHSVSEVQELRQNLDAARAEAMTDQLTGIANRKAFDEALLDAVAAATQKEKPLTLVMADIDHFKKFNDTYGHQTGDQVLRLVGHCYRHNLKGKDTPARYGGEEFGMILPDTSAGAGEQIANQIREIVQARELVKRSTGESLGCVTMSFGVAQFRPGDTPETLIERADTALYAAKGQGRNCVVNADTIDPAEKEAV